MDDCCCPATAIVHTRPYQRPVEQFKNSLKIARFFGNFFGTNIVLSIDQSLNRILRGVSCAKEYVKATRACARKLNESA
jgi:hypothetical protein